MRSNSIDHQRCKLTQILLPSLSNQISSLKMRTQKLILLIAIIAIACNYSCGDVAKIAKLGSRAAKATKSASEYSDSSSERKDGLDASGSGVRITKHDNGKTKAEVEYVNRKRHGKAVDYYDSGEVRMEMQYKNGVKDGLAKFYYEGGGLYQETFYEKGQMEGIRTRYHKNGEKMAEIPYHKGGLGKGTKEWDKTGKLITKYDAVNIDVKKKRTSGEQMLLELRLPKGKSYKAKYYYGALTDGKYLNNDLVKLKVSKSVGEMTFAAPKGINAARTIDLAAEFQSVLGNPRLVSRKYEVTTF